MSSSAEIIKQNHRRQWMMSASGVVGLLVLSILPHNERGLFIVDSAEARALAAIVPAPDFDAVPLFPVNGGTPTAFFARVPGVPRAPVGGLAGPADPDAIGPGLPPAATDPTPAIFGSPAGDTPIQTAGLGPGPFGSRFPFGPGGLGPTNSGPSAVAEPPATSTGGGTSTGGDTSTGGGTTSTGGGTTSTGGGTTSTGGGTTSSGGTTSGGGIDKPVPAVPEPATWMMLIAGFAITGLALRRTRRQRLNSVRAGFLSS